ncbi:hypothetical protein BV25DRAFT_1099219 [Artomyces pyxidatus]|uniref:Uncharacterized protein n=1 Tax=Artomyces pyxidatus TaxID=48021 RepID=A0ACB8TG72_9AGAM|nr:hypothetical protein BV25DRAFT_1099219 [Artomyces pyxidatus]
MSSPLLSATPLQAADLSATTSTIHNLAQPRCYQCRRPLSDTLWKSCPSCREKGREKSKIANLRAKEKKAARAQLVSHEMAAAAASSVRTAVAMKKRKLADEGQTVDFTWVTPSSNKPGKQSGSADKNTPQKRKDHHGEPDEYLSSTDALAALSGELESARVSSHVATDLLDFRLVYAIVADPFIDNKQRVDQVVRSLRDIGLRFSVTFTPLAPGHSRYARPRSVTERRRCKCLKENSEAVPAASTSDAPGQLKRKQSDLAQWLMKAGDTHPQATSSSGKCGGYIYISSEYDSSHPAGIRGQRIVVTVVHKSSR